MRVTMLSVEKQRIQQSSPYGVCIFVRNNYKLNTHRGIVACEKKNLELVDKKTTTTTNPTSSPLPNHRHSAHPRPPPSRSSKLSSSYSSANPAYPTSAP